MSKSDGLIQRGLDKNRDQEEMTHAPDGRPASEQPRWRQDFPIDWRRDEYVSRRELVKFMVLTSAAFAVGQIWVTIRQLFRVAPANPDARVIATVGELPIGGAKTFAYPEGSTPRLLVRTGESSFVAYDQACTHLMCPVVPEVALGKLHCPCHNGWFDLKTGAVLAGPPQRALPRVFVEVRGGEIWATGVEEQAS
jgi:Rieske Fe-S protein